MVPPLSTTVTPVGTEYYLLLYVSFSLHITFRSYPHNKVQAVKKEETQTKDISES